MTAAASTGIVIFLFWSEQAIDQLLIKVIRNITFNVMVYGAYKNGFGGVHNSHDHKEGCYGCCNAYNRMYKHTQEE